MSFIDRDTNSTTLTGSDSAATFATKRLTGLLQAIHYTPNSTTTALSTTATLAVAAEACGVTVLSLNLTSTVQTTWQPRSSIHSTAGSTVAGFAQFSLADERLTFTLDNGGVGKGGTFRVDVA